MSCHVTSTFRRPVLVPQAAFGTLGRCDGVASQERRMRKLFTTSGPHAFDREEEVTDRVCVSSSLQLGQASDALFIEHLRRADNSNSEQLLHVPPSLGVRPSNRRDGHIISSCAPLVSVAALSDGRVGVPWASESDAQIARLPFTYTGDTT
jgi:hypothetical protein